MNWRTYTFLVLAVLTSNAAQIPRRMNGSIRDSATFSLMGNTRPMLVLAQDRGPISNGHRLQRMTMRFAMSQQQHEDLDQLLRQQQAAESAQFHQFLTPDEYGARFGVNQEDIAQISAWLSDEGFSNIETARSKTFLSFSGTASQVETAFHTSIHKYVQNGEMHYANVSDPLLPKAIEGMVEGIEGLHDFRRRPMNIRKLHPHYTSNISGAHYLAPNDFATIYNVQPLYQSGFDGTGVKIAVVGQSDILLTDIQAFRAAAGLPQNNPTIMLVGTDPGRLSSSGDETESDLDIEWSGAIAKNATIIFVTELNVVNSITYVIDNSIAPILSISYGLCESETGLAANNTQKSEFAQANAEGITVVASAGDSGAADCDTTYPSTHGLAVDLPAALPYVTGIGGTTFSEGSGTYWNSTNNNNGGSAISYIPEVVWNDSSSSSGLEAGGGGQSVYNTKPVWQTGPGVPADAARDVPDISFAASPAHDGFLICSNGDCVTGFRNTNTTLDVIGGTSCGSPSFAGILALMVEKLGPQGNINPELYSLAATSTDVFHDVTLGTNAVTCRLSTNCASGTIGYPATTGYDLASGWGSVDAYHLVNEWTSNTGTASRGPLEFVPITPCRAADTRNATGAFGGPELATGQTREFDLPSSGCSIPTTAVAYELNLTVIPNSSLGYLSSWPSGEPKPLVSTLNSDGRVKANAVMVMAGTNGGVDVYASDATTLVIDISGYFVTAGMVSGALQFFPLTPCRIADTRLATGALGGPYLTGGQSRPFPIQSSACHVPTSATAYSLNFTAIPQSGLGFLNAWPAGQSQPLASVLNASRGGVTANAAIIEAGTGGAITAYSSDNTDLVIDINGYFAPAATGGLSLYTLTPCRVIDTRNPAGALPFSGTTTVNVAASGCGSPSTAQAYVLNATVVPTGGLSYLSLWPNGQSIPLVSTLNSDANAVTSNLAVVGTNNGMVNAFAAGITYLILDISGYFAP